MIRIAAVGDVHVEADGSLLWSERFAHVAHDADALLLAGDLTRGGTREEALALADALRNLPIPRIAVLGNHDYHAGEQAEITRVLEDVGVTVLEGSTTTLEVDGMTVGIAGTKGFGGGFAGACGSDFGEDEMKSFIGHTKRLARRLQETLAELRSEVRIALLHYSPVADTLQGERLEIYPFLGSYLLAEAIDNAGADLVLHGHAHGGVERGLTPAGIHVRNVAVPVIKRAYGVFCLPDGHACAEAASL